MKFIVYRLEGTFWYWKLTKKDQVLCCSANLFDSEKDARSNIATFKRSVPVKFAKVVVDDASI